MSTTLLPKDYGYVFLGLGATFLANIYLVINVSKARKKYGIKYPALYATKDHIDGKKCKNQEDVNKFNSVQRAHQNTCENKSSIQLIGALNGLLFPRFSATCLGMYALGRILYGRGYAVNGPKGRIIGAIISHLGDMPLLICTFYSGLMLSGFV
eukprot:g4819.t1